jgi:hypothetical protein
MTVSVAQFRARHPEFAAAPPDAVVQDALDKALRMLDSTVISSTLLDDATEWQAYLFLGASPYSRDKRVSSVVGDDHLATARKCLDDILMASGRAYRILP